MIRGISFIGDGNALPGSDIYEVARNAAKLVASKGYCVICGGLLGVMEAAARGAKEAGGLTVGILPGYDFNANDYIDVVIPTGMGQARNVIVIAASNIVVAFGGNYGTLSEIAHALKLNKRVLGYKTWQLEGLENHESRDSFLDRLAALL